MFKKKQDIEQDFMHYNTDNSGFEKNNQKNSLDNIVKILIILLLIVALIGVLIFIYNSLTKSNINQSQNSSSLAFSDTQMKKVYTQEDMQAIVQMIVKQMQEQQNKSATNSSENNMVDHVADLDKKIDKSIKNVDANTKAKSKQNTDSVNYYNKVVVATNSSNDDEMLDLSKGLDELILTQENKDDKYTKMISKEIEIRENEMRVIVVKKGDTLSLIAERAYGSSQAFDILLKANPELIKNPNLIYAGQRLRVPIIKN